MDKHLLGFTLYVVIVILASSILTLEVAAIEPPWGARTHFCGVSHYQPRWRPDSKGPGNRNYARAFANLNVGPARTVRLIYFLPNDRRYRADVVQKMKDEIRTVQTFFADQMESHGYGRATFRVETDSQGEPIVHRVNGQHPDRHYLEDTFAAVLSELELAFDFSKNIYLIVVDNSIDGIGRGNGRIVGGVGGRREKNGGRAMVSAGDFVWDLVAHELGHAFGLDHDFHDGAYIMSYGPGWNRLSAYHAGYLSVHPYFNRNIPIEATSPPTIELISPRTYPAGSQRVVVRLKVNDSEGLHQLFLFVTTIEPHRAAGSFEVKACRELGGKKAAIAFYYDGVIPSTNESDRSTSLLNPLIHPIRIEAIDIDGDRSRTDFVLFSETAQPLTKISGDNQHGLRNRPLPVPFVVEVWDLNAGDPLKGIPITFRVTAGGGRLSVSHIETDLGGRAESTLTLGPNLGTNTVLVSAGGIEGVVTFTTVAVRPVYIADQNLRTAIEDALAVSPRTPIAPAAMATLTRLEAQNANISDLTGLEHATNLAQLYLPENSISDLSSLASLTNLTNLSLWDNTISDISAVAGLTNLTELALGGNDISDISPVAGLARLTNLHLPANNISDASVVSGLARLTYLNLNDTTIRDLSFLSSLTQLKDLYLGWNNITDISVLSGLTNLTKLWLMDNNISDLSPLVANTGLGEGDEVDVRRNPLSYTSIHTHIPNRQSRGITVEFDNQAHAALLKISGDNQTGASFLLLSQPFVVEARDENGFPLAGFSVTFAVTAGGGTLSTTITRTDPNGRAQSTLRLGPNLERHTVEVSAAAIEVPATFHAVSDTKPPPTIADVNNDGSITHLDLVLLALNYGQIGQNPADVNSDDVVDIADLIIVASVIDTVAPAPSAQPQTLEMFRAADVKLWLSHARQLDLTDQTVLRAILFLEQLLTALKPKETTLLPNYPNPFNPETWIPFRLADNASVTLTIYDSKGQVVRTLNMGYQMAAVYENRSKAIYWDGRNNLGEQVASGVYFYHLLAGDYTATRRMVILK